MRGSNAANEILKPIFTLLAKNGADMNICYPEGSYSDEENYKCSIIINIVRRNKLEMDVLAKLICLF
jgi:hypothetical protein